MTGLVRGTPEFERAVLKEKVNRCMQMQDVPSCTECPRFEYCDLRLAYWRCAALGPEYSHVVDEESLEETDPDFPEEG